MHPSVPCFLNLSIHGNQVPAERLQIFFSWILLDKIIVNDEKSLKNAFLWEFNFGILFFLIFFTLWMSTSRAEMGEKHVLECMFGAQIQLQH